MESESECETGFGQTQHMSGSGRQTACKHDSLGARKHNIRHRKHTRANTTQPSRLKCAIKTLDGFKRTSENPGTYKMHISR